MECSRFNVYCTTTVTLRRSFFSRGENMASCNERVFFSMRPLSPLTFSYLIILCMECRFSSIRTGIETFKMIFCTPHIAPERRQAVEHHTEHLQSKEMPSNAKIARQIDKTFYVVVEHAIIIIINNLLHSSAQPPSLWRIFQMLLNVDGAVCCLSDYCCCCRSYPLHM